MSTAQYIVNDLEALEWCNKLHDEGFELKMTWDGGGDSGWVDFVVDKATLSEEDETFINYLRDKCYEELDYGSWAGEFYASGYATFDPGHKAFVGIDDYSEDDSINKECELRIAIPKDVWFDSVEIMVQDESVEVTADIIVRNGFKTDAHTAAEAALEKSIQDQVNEIVSDIDNYRSMWEEINLSPSDFTLEGDEMVHVMKDISVGVYISDEKEIFINLDTEE